jgi:hypothetical protein
MLWTLVSIIDARQAAEHAAAPTLQATPSEPVPATMS